MSKKNTIAKSFVLLLLLIILVLAGLLWFDYLGVINAKSMFAPLYKLAGLEPQTTAATAEQIPLVPANLNADRLAKRLESVQIEKELLDKREQDIVAKEKENAQIAKDLADKLISQEEREKTFNNQVKKYDDKSVNIVQNAKNLTGMPPQSAVDIMLAMEDQDVIDILRKVDEIAVENGESSMVSYWLSLMPSSRVAQIQRKMLSKPTEAQVAAD